jgi:hypothetical protein
MGRGFGGQHALLDHLIRPQEDRLWDRKPKSLRSLTNSNFVGCSTGQSAAFAPLRSLSTNVADR